MRMWMSFGLFPAAVIVALLLLASGSVIGLIAAVIWGFGVMPHGANYIRRHSSLRDDARLEEDETHYWRVAGWR